MAALLIVESLTKAYESRGFFSREGVRAVHDVSFEVWPGKVIGLVGESGSGKSTIARCIAGLVKPSSGFVRLLGRDIWEISSAERRKMRRHIQMVFQSPMASFSPRMRVGDAVAGPMRNFLDLSSVEERDRLHDLFEQVGLSPRDVRRFPHELSGGQLQRAAVARAISTQPDLVILDEPTSALDASIRLQILRLLSSLQSDYSKMAYLHISHDLRSIAFHADDLLVLKDGESVERGPVDKVLGAPKHPYTRQLVEAIPGRVAWKKNPGG